MTLREVIERPALRGHVHLAAALITPFALAYLIAIAESPRAYVAAAIFGIGLQLLFSVSAAYHLAPWPARLRSLVGRVDHSTIFVVIGACYTPFCLEALTLPWGISMLVVTWSLCVLGVVMKLAWPAAPRWLGIGAYLGVGWIALVAIVPLTAALSVVSSFVMLAAGFLYSAGALAYATRWPNPFPRLVGYHEVFHVLVTVATFLLYAVVAIEVLPA